MAELLTAGVIELPTLFPPAEGVTFRIAAARPHLSKAGHRGVKVTFEAVAVPDGESPVGRRIEQIFMLEGERAPLTTALLVAAGVDENEFQQGDAIGKEIVADVVHEQWLGEYYETLNCFRAARKGPSMSAHDLLRQLPNAKTNDAEPTPISTDGEARCLLDRLLASGSLAAESHEAGYAVGLQLVNEQQVTRSEAVRLAQLAARLREDRAQVREALLALLPNLFLDAGESFSSGRLEPENFRDGLLEGVAAALEDNNVQRRQS